MQRAQNVHLHGTYIAWRNNHRGNNPVLHHKAQRAPRLTALISHWTEYTWTPLAYYLGMYVDQLSNRPIFLRGYIPGDELISCIHG